MAKRPREDSVSALTSPTTGRTTVLQPSPTKSARVSPQPRTRNAIACALPPHPKPIGFASIQDYELHYQKVHLHACHDCGRDFPTPHMLSLHIAENHDPILAARRARGDKVYACLVERCDKVCSSWRKRKLHVLAKHGFPEDYDFLVIDKGLGARRSMLRRDWEKWHKPREAPQRDGKAADMENVDGLYDDAAIEEAGVAGSDQVNTDNVQVIRDSHDGNMGGEDDALEEDVRGNDVSESDTSEDEESEEGESDDSSTNDDRDDDDDESVDDNILDTKRKNPRNNDQKLGDRIPGSETKSKDDLTDLTESMSALEFVPRSVRFGRGGRRGLAKQ